MTFFFEDRADAGRQLGIHLSHLHVRDPLILALPRGGVVVGHEVAQTLNAPWDVVVARKISAPGHPEFGIGAISEDEEAHFSPESAFILDPASGVKSFLALEEKAELHRRVRKYRGERPLPDLRGRTVIVVDDGLATGVTAVAAAKFLRTLHPDKLILAVPIGPKTVSADLSASFDNIVCLKTLHHLRSVGHWYNDFTQVEDEEVLRLLKDRH